MIKFNNGYEMPVFGLGTFLMDDKEETKKVIKEAYQIGYRHFDTAKGYHNEDAIGEALSELGVDRSEYFITTKIIFHYNKDKTRELITDSLNKLKTDYIDLLLIHWPNHDVEINVNTWKVFEEFYNKGKIKALGVSNFTRFQLEEFLPRVTIKPVVNQVEFHPILNQKQMFNYLDKYDIKLMGYGPLARGNVFTGRSKKVLEVIANKYNTDIAAVVLAWGLAKGAILIPKTVNKERLISNFSAKDLKLDIEDIKMIDSLHDARRYYSDPANNVYGLYRD